MANDSVKVIVEKNVPFLENLDQVAEVIRLPYDKINSMAVLDADALVVRTRNRCDASLLNGSSVKFIATATIGTDHIDIPWCKAHGIEVANAPGSNAPAVAQYVFSSLMRVINRPLSEYSIGIVGVGHVGSIVERWARQMNMKTLLCDPVRAEEENDSTFVSLSKIAEEADIITFHTPLIHGGKHPTYHLADNRFFNSLRRAPIVINSARGPVIDNKAWVDALEAGIVGPAIVDCWEGEPQLNLRLLELASIATPHIAGYSMEGKLRASQMILDALCRYFSLPQIKATGRPAAPCAPSINPAEALRGYDPMPETVALKADPSSFEPLRNEYPLRPELLPAPNP